MPFWGRGDRKEPTESPPNTTADYTTSCNRRLLCSSISGPEGTPQSVRNHRSAPSSLTISKQILYITRQVLKNLISQRYSKIRVDRRNSLMVPSKSPSSPHPMYSGVIPIASRAAMKLLSRVSSKTNEKMPSNMSTNPSPCSSYYRIQKQETKTIYFSHSNLRRRNGSHKNLIWNQKKPQFKGSYQVSNNFAITSCPKFVISQAFPQFFMVVNLSIHL